MLSQKLSDSFAFVLGILLTFAFAPFNLWPIAIISPALLLILWTNTTPRRAFFRGWLFGIGFFGAGVSWVFISIYTYGNVPAWLAGIITAGFIIILALFPACNGYLLNRFFPTNNVSRTLCAFPALWLSFEWLRSWLFTGFPWLLLGYTQLNTPLKGYAPIFSVYGVSLAVLLTSALSILCLKPKKILRYSSILLLFALWLGGSLLSNLSWTKTQGNALKISLVQGNIEQSIKWLPDQLMPTIDHYLELTASHWDSPIIIWPEAAIPIPLQEADNIIQALTQLAIKHHAHIITGIPIQDFNTGNYYNGVITLGATSGMYLKQRLVPFGEYTPFPKYLPNLLSRLNIPLSNFTSGGDSSVNPILFNNIPVATFICYEIAFPELVRIRDPHIGLILTVSNDGWFGQSIARDQHLQMAAMRSLEMERPSIFVSNTGLTAIIDPNSKIASMAPPDKATVLTGWIQPRIGQTPWQLMGLLPMYLIVIALLVISLLPPRLPRGIQS